MSLRNNVSVIRQSSIAIILSNIASVIAGVFLGKSEALLLMLPGLIVLIPGVIDMRGVIFSSMGSRLSSQLHLGSLKRFSLSNKVVKRNIYSSLTLSLLLSIGLAFLAKLFANIVHYNAISLSSFIMISVIGTLISSVFMLVFTFVISFKSFSSGWDPDNVTAPTIATLGDFFTVPSLLFAAIIIGPYVDLMMYFAGFVIFLGIANLVIMLATRNDYKAIVKESWHFIALSSVLSIVSGMLIQENLHLIVAVPSILVLIPAFVGQSGNIGSILSSRLSTKFHLGTLRLKFDSKMREEFGISYAIALIIFPILAIVVYAFSSLFSIASQGLLSLVVTTTIAGLMMITIISFVSFWMSILSYKLNLDPDNVVIPVVTGVADIVGVISLISILTAFGVI